MEREVIRNDRNNPNTDRGICYTIDNGIFAQIVH